MKKGKTPVAGSDFKKQFIALIKSFSSKHHTYQVFRDFVALSARSISNQSFVFQQKLEDEYLAIVKNYNREELDKICQLLALTIEGLSSHYHDFLGDCFMSLDLGNERAGQFFSPYSVSQLMAGIQFSSLEKLPEKGFITVQEPAVGAGGMLIACAEMFIQKGYRPETQMFCVGIDIDAMVAEMAYIQLSWLNIPAQICVGNSLSQVINRSYYTPAYYLYNWYGKLRDKAPDPVQHSNVTVEEIKQLLTEVAPDTLPIAPVVASPSPEPSPARPAKTLALEQIALF